MLRALDKFGYLLFVHTGSHSQLKFKTTLNPDKKTSLRLTHDLFGRLCVYNICNFFPFLYFTFMIYTVSHFICFDISMMFIFLIFFLSDFIINCNLTVYHSKAPSQFLPDRKSPSFRTYAWDDNFWTVGRQQSQNWSGRLNLSLGVLF